MFFRLSSSSRDDITPNLDFSFIDTYIYILRWIVMSQIETPGVLNGYLVFREHVMMNIKKISDVFIIPADSSQNFRFCEFTR